MEIFFFYSQMLGRVFVADITNLLSFMKNCIQKRRYKLRTVLGSYAEIVFIGVWTVLSKIKTVLKKLYKRTIKTTNSQNNYKSIIITQVILKRISNYTYPSGNNLLN